MDRTRIRITGWHRGGPWPAWLRWYRSTGWWARDARAWELYHVQGLTQEQIATLLGCSQSSASRGIRRTAQRMAGEWPPPTTNGFGLSYAQRRAKRLDGARGPKLSESERTYQVPSQLQDQDDPDGQGWDSWTG
jgi:hypothetical protein